MSWDLFVQDWGNVDSLSEIPGDFEPQSIGSRTEIIARIIEVEPSANFLDPAWGTLENDQFSIEFNMGETEEMTGFAMHVRGSNQAISCIKNILKHLGLRVADGDGFLNV